LFFSRGDGSALRFYPELDEKQPSEQQPHARVRAGEIRRVGRRRRSLNEVCTFNVLMKLCTSQPQPQQQRITKRPPLNCQRIRLGCRSVVVQSRYLNFAPRDIRAAPENTNPGCAWFPPELCTVRVVPDRFKGLHRAALSVTDAHSAAWMSTRAWPEVRMTSGDRVRENTSPTLPFACAIMPVLRQCIRARAHRP
jgi:hypothetical protein